MKKLTIQQLGGLAVKKKHPNHFSEMGKKSQRVQRKKRLLAKVANKTNK